MTAEEYFKKEFKAYSEYKNHLLMSSGYDGYRQDPRISQIMGSLPLELAQYRDAQMKTQLDYLRGLDLGCKLSNSGRVLATDFLIHCLPMAVQKEALSDKGFVEYCALQNITEPYFKELNKSLCILQPRISYQKRVTGSDKQFVTNANGEVVMRDIDIPNGSRVIMSHKNIHLPNKITTDSGRTQRVFVSDGFGYIDYVDTPEGRRYLYYIPREYIYPVNNTALVLTTSRLHSKYYWGRQYTFNRGVACAYLYVMPYDKSIFKPDNVVFCMKDNLDFEREVKMLEDYWQSGTYGRGAAPVILYKTQDLLLETVMGFDDSGETTMAYKTLAEPTREPFVWLDKSLAEMGTDDGISYA